MNYEVIPVQSGTVDSAWGVECGLCGIYSSAIVMKVDLTTWLNGAAGFLHICHEL